ncbi:MAG TPA: glycosyltransferase family 2 protein [Kiritimatiellia bacterium]|nr:glycosyltransferase family 2 protein [Kiritimatiellia bacterium]
MENKKLSIVIPIFNEEKTIPELWSRLGKVLDDMALNSEVVFVDDGSADGSGELLKQICRQDPRTKLIRLSRNFGHQPALTAGIDHASGDAIVLMDADLQDRPEAIPDFVREWNDGAHVVYAVRTSRRENAAMRVAFKLFYRVLARMSGIRIPADAGIFGLLDRKVVSVLKSMPEKNRYLPGLRAYAGFTQKGVPVSRDARFAGKPRVGLTGLVGLALDAVFAFSWLPIRMASYLGLLIAAFSFCVLGFVMYQKIVSHQAILGWASTLGAILFIGGIQLITLGILGEYVGRIYDETKQRPFYVIGEKINL